MRNHLVHGYSAVDADALWAVVTVEIPDLHRDGPLMAGGLAIRAAGSRAERRARRSSGLR
jgi:hypothetical protein